MNRALIPAIGRGIVARPRIGAALALAVLLSGCTEPLKPEAFEFFDPYTNTMRIMPGKYEIYYGNSSDTPSQNRLEVELL